MRVEDFAKLTKSYNNGGNLVDAYVEIKDALQKHSQEPRPLTLEELQNRTTPVFTPSDDQWGGFYCLCRNGYIIPPSGMGFDASERLSWKFYDKPL